MRIPRRGIPISRPYKVGGKVLTSRSMRFNKGEKQKRLRISMVKLNQTKEIPADQHGKKTESASENDTGDNLYMFFE